MRKRKYIFVVSVTSLVFAVQLVSKQSLNNILGTSVRQGSITPIELPQIVLTPSATPTPQASSSATFTEEVRTAEAASPSGKMIVESTPTPSPHITPTSATSEEINGYVERFSNQYGVDPNVLRHIAICESGFRSSATNYIYAGLYQFGPTTWENIRKEIGEDANIELRFSAEESVQTAAYALSHNKGGIWPNCFPK